MLRTGRRPKPLDAPAMTACGKVGHYHGRSAPRGFRAMRIGAPSCTAVGFPLGVPAFRFLHELLALNGRVIGPPSIFHPVWRGWCWRVPDEVACAGSCCSHHQNCDSEAGPERTLLDSCDGLARIEMTAIGTESLATS